MNCVERGLLKELHLELTKQGGIILSAKVPEFSDLDIICHDSGPHTSISPINRIKCDMELLTGCYDMPGFLASFFSGDVMGPK